MLFITLSTVSVPIKRGNGEIWTDRYPPRAPGAAQYRSTPLNPGYLGAAELIPGHFISGR